MNRKGVAFVIPVAGIVVLSVLVLLLVLGIGLILKTLVGVALVGVGLWGMITKKFKPAIGVTMVALGLVIVINPFDLVDKSLLAVGVGP